MSNHVIRDRLWESKKLRRCSRDAALAYPWIFLVADDWGRFEYDPTRICSKVFGARTDVTLAEVTTWLEEYEREGLLSRYQHEGDELATWTNFQGRPASQRRPSAYQQPVQEVKPSARDGLAEALVDKDQIGSGSELDLDRSTPPTPPGGSVRRVFDHWRTVMGHEPAQLTPKRERCVRQMLKLYTPEQLIAAVDGCKASPWNMGANDRSEVYDDLALICRDGEHVERFMRIAGNGSAALAHREARVAPPPDARDRKQRAGMVAAVVGGLKGDGTAGGGR